MIETTLSNMLNSSDFFKTSEIIHILDGRKKEEIGFFVPSIFRDEFQKFIDKIEKKKKISLLERVARAQEKDPIEEGSIDDAIR
jgi:Mg/Co/Ni transporter MgtE